MGTVPVELDQLTDRQLHLYLITLLGDQHAILQRLDVFMADLTSSVSALQTAVDSVAVRFASQLVPLTEALTQAQSALDALQDVSEADKAALADALSQIDTAAQAIDAEVAELNSLGAEPTVPVEPVPVEEMPAPPSEEGSTDEV